MCDFVSFVHEETGEFEKFAMVPWATWQRRNKLRSKEASTPVHKIYRLALTLLAEFQLKKPKLVAQGIASPSHWQPPPSNSEKANFDVLEEVLQSREMEVSEATKGRGLHGEFNKVVLAYCGGLDTSVIVPWQRENYGCDFVSVTADVGQAMVDIAKEARADAVSHGCTGKGIQVRINLPFFAPNPKLNAVDPWKEWDIIGREDAIESAKKHNVPIPVTKKSIYSGDRNLWHLSHEGDILEDLANKPKKDMFMLTVDPEEAQDKPENIEIGIGLGLPVSVNGKVLSPASLLAELNKIGGKHGVGQIDMVENRLDAFMEKITEITTDSVFVTGCRKPL